LLRRWLRRSWRPRSPPGSLHRPACLRAPAPALAGSPACNPADLIRWSGAPNLWLYHGPSSSLPLAEHQLGRQRARCWPHFRQQRTSMSSLLIWSQEAPPALMTAPPSPALQDSPDGCPRRTSPAAVFSSLALQQPGEESIRPEKTKKRPKK
jgi:hypothetical protein